MKKILLLSSFLCVASVSLSAMDFTFKPNPVDLNDLDHHNATTWGITWDAIPEGEVILGATLTIKNIWDWRVENNDALFIHLLDNPKKTGVRTVVDDPNDNVKADYFLGQGIHLDTWTDPQGGVARNFNYVYNFDEADLDVLTQYITNANASVMKSVWVSGKWVHGTWVPGHWTSVVDYTPADFGFGFDPDCHYYNDGVSFVITTGKPPHECVPDSGTTMLLLGTSVGVLFAFARRFRA